MAAARRRSDSSDGEVPPGGRHTIESRTQPRGDSDHADADVTETAAAKPDAHGEHVDSGSTGAAHIDFTWDGDWQAPRESLPTLHDIDPLRHDTAPPSASKAEALPAARDALPTLEDEDPLRHDVEDAATGDPAPTADPDETAD